MQGIPTPTPELIGAATAEEGNLAVTALQPGIGGQVSGSENVSLALTVKNGFSFVTPTTRQSLTIVPISRLAILTFTIGRDTSWGTGWLEAFSWVGYAPTHDVVKTFANSNLQMGRVRVLAGTSKAEALALGITTFPMEGLVGQIVWTY
jgi:hypothetical protein